MGLFRRSPTVDPAEVAALRSELAGVQEHLAYAVSSRSAMERRLADLEQALHAADSAAAEAAADAARIVPPPPPSPPPPPPTVSLDEVRSLAQRAAELAGQADHRVGELSEQLAAGVQPNGESAPDLGEALASLAVLQRQVGELAERVATSGHDSRQAHDLAAALEERLGRLGNELTCQIDELASEVDEVRRQSDAGAGTGIPAMSTEAVDELRASQERLAHEQARYEIAFRQDLAELADLMRRKT